MSVRKYPIYDIGKIAEKSNYEANLYVFLNGNRGELGKGQAPPNTVCNRGRLKRVSIIQYTFEGKDIATGRV